MIWLKQIKARIQSATKDRTFSEILSGSVWALGARVGTTLFGLVTSVIVVRFYGAEILGTVAILNSFLALATIFTVMGMNTSVLRLIPEHTTKYSASSAYGVYRLVLRLLLTVSICASIVLYLLSGSIAETVFSKPHLAFYFSLAAIFLVFKTLMLVNTQAVRAVRKIRLFAFMQILPALSKLLLLLPLTIFFFHPDHPVYTTFASFVVTALVGLWAVVSTLKGKSDPRDVIHEESPGTILGLSLPMLMTGTMNFVIGQAGVIFLGMFRSETDVAYYSIAVMLSSLTMFVLGAVNSMAAPVFSDLFHSGKIPEVFNIAKRSAKLAFWATAPLLIALVVLGRPVITLLYGEGFLVAFWAMLPLIVGQLVNSMSGATALFMNMTGHQKAFRNIMAATAVINISLNLWLIPLYGIFGAAIVAMISLASWNLAALLFIKLNYKRSTGYFPLIG